MVIDAKVVNGPRRKKSGLMLEIKRLPWVSIVILVLLLFIIAFAGILTPYDPNAISLREQFTPPAWDAAGSSDHLLGTDTLGRDLLTRILYGARVSMLVAVLVILISGSIGLTLGIIAGYIGGWVDAIISRAVDSFMAIPDILLALVFAVTLGPSMTTVVIALTAVTWARFTRIIRGEALSIRTREFILQAKVAGCSVPRILFIHILPNVLNVFMIIVTLEVAAIILIEAALSFLGAGIPPPDPSWGQMVAEGRGYIINAYWITLFPGLALGLTVFAFQLLGDWLRDRFDPKLRQI